MGQVLSVEAITEACFAVASVVRAICCAVEIFIKIFIEPPTEQDVRKAAPIVIENAKNPECTAKYTTARCEQRHINKHVNTIEKQMNRYDLKRADDYLNSIPY